MSRVRVSHTEWRDEGPAVARLRGAPSYHISAATVSNMTPVVSGGVPSKHVSDERREQWREAQARSREKQRCGFQMRSAKGPCHRLPGHGWDHRSEDAMENQRRLDSARAAGA